MSRIRRQEVHGDLKDVHLELDLMIEAIPTEAHGGEIQWAEDESWFENQERRILDAAQKAANKAHKRGMLEAVAMAEDHMDRLRTKIEANY